MNNELTAVLTRSPQLAVQAPLPTPAARVPAKATDLRVDVKSTAPLALDLSGVTFMDCAGISVLLAARRLARLDGGWVRVLQASHRARKVLTLTGLHREFALAGPETAGIA
jgi:anti-anti-sigma factor